MIKQQFDIDKHLEDVSIRFLQTKTNIFKELKVVEKVLDRQRQSQGIDLVCLQDYTMSNRKYTSDTFFVDVKSMAGLIPTFAFELCNLTSGAPGWLINPNNQTDKYLLVYHEIRESYGDYKQDKMIISVNNIETTKAILISKQAVLNIIQDFYRNNVCFDKWVTQVKNNLPNLKEKKTYRFIVDNNTIKFKKQYDKPNIYLTLSAGLREKPLNLLIRRELLEKYAEKVWIITSNLEWH